MRNMRVSQKEPLLPTDLLERPWKEVRADLFTLKWKMYLLLVECYSSYVEMANLHHIKFADVTVNLKSGCLRS